jgi:hypothetical protein
VAGLRGWESLGKHDPARSPHADTAHAVAGEQSGLGLPPSLRFPIRSTCLVGRSRSGLRTPLHCIALDFQSRWYRRVQEYLSFLRGGRWGGGRRHIWRDDTVLRGPLRLLLGEMHA